MKVTVNNLTKEISRNLVLDNINLEFEGGKIYGFVGKNGSGKTMLMRAICGLILPTSGNVKIDDKILGKDISFPESVGALIEHPGFVSSYSGYRNLKTLAQIKRKIGDREITNALESVGLDPKEKKSFKKYSLGMKQKLGIAAAIMETPDILILDEPFNALDEETVDKVRDIIINSRREDRIVFLSCHDREEIDKICDEIIFLKLGKVVEPTRSIDDGEDN